MIYQTQGKHTDMIYQTQGKHTDMIYQTLSVCLPWVW
jgi:hypothetical protein